ncbi:MAG: hypothetical protein ACYC7E_12270 [Armatimonadota bacterium]
MSSRGFLFVAALFLSITGWLPGYADDAAAPATTAQPSPSSTTLAADLLNRPQITYDDYIVRADHIGISLKENTLLLDGNVEMLGHGGVLRAEKGIFDRKGNTGSLENVIAERDPFRFTAQSMTIDQHDVKRVRRAAVTTCSDKEHPHYRLLSRSLVIFPDESYDARRSTLEINGNKLFYVPYIHGSFSDEDDFFSPGLKVGKSRIDGAYFGSEYLIPLGGDGAVATLEGRFGTKGILRGGAYIEQPFSFSGGLLKGNLRLTGSYRSDVENNTLSFDSSLNPTLQNLTVNRLPTTQLIVDPVKLSGPMRGFTFRFSASAGRYEEIPTDVVANRAQGWGVLASPALRLGSSQVRAEYGIRQAFYQNHDQMTTSALQLTLESSPPAKNFYYNLSYLRRSTRGSTPFLFDRVMLPEELYAEVDVPLTRSGRWRLDIYNRYDLAESASRSTGVTLSYNLDCMAYGLMYIPTTKAFGFGIALNAFDSFRRGAGSLSFPE